MLVIGGGLTGAGVLRDLIGSGPGRGIGVMFVVLGVFVVAVSALAWRHPAMRGFDELVPDAAPTAAPGRPEPGPRPD